MVMGPRADAFRTTRRPPTSRNRSTNIRSLSPPGRPTSGITSASAGDGAPARPAFDGQPL